MQPLKIKDLYEMVKKEIEKGNSDKVVMLSNDDEGNGYHYLYYSFTSGKRMQIDDMFIMSVDKDIAKIEDTIVLG